MYASIRVYPNAGSVNELAQFFDERFLPAISTAPGFRAYDAVDVGDGVVASVSIFEDPSGAEKSNRMAADFVRGIWRRFRRCHVIEPQSREFGRKVMLTVRPSRSAIRSSLCCETGVMSFE
jgi:hypothetical protein